MTDGTLDKTYADLFFAYIYEWRKKLRVYILTNVKYEIPCLSSLRSCVFRFNVWPSKINFALDLHGIISWSREDTVSILGLYIIMVMT